MSPWIPARVDQRACAKVADDHIQMDAPCADRDFTKDLICIGYPMARTMICASIATVSMY